MFQCWKFPNKTKKNFLSIKIRSEIPIGGEGVLEFRTKSEIPGFFYLRVPLVHNTLSCSVKNQDCSLGFMAICRLHTVR